MFNFVDGECKKVGEDTQFSVKICTSIAPSSLDAPKINNYLIGLDINVHLDPTMKSWKIWH
jgi:hypothetical protein